MCGICGWIYDDNSYPVKEAMLREAASRMIHRGPDAEGLYVAPGVGLAMRRLAIIDLAAGDQPMWTDDHRYAIVYNGECYNHRQLRRKLEAKGYAFKTRCDTEVVLKGYAEWGAEVLLRLNGMYAFAIWDTQGQELFLARDRLGIKPLYYFMGKGRLAFASEIKCLFADPAVTKAPDLQALNDFLTYKYIPTPRTGFAQINKLPAGHYACYKNGELSISKYWDLDFSRKQLSLQDAQACVEEALRCSVAARLMSDVPLGVMLSGGVDSSLVTAYAAQEQDSINTYSMGFPAKEYDESSHARRVARHLGAVHHEEMLSADALEDLEALAWHLEEPLGDSSAMPLMALCRMTRKHVTVALAGDGGDELGAGYPRYWWDARADRLAGIPGLLNLSGFASRLLQLMQTLRETGRRIEKFSRTASLPQEERYLCWHTCFSAAEKKNLFTPEILQQLGVDRDKNLLLPFFDNARNAEALTRLQYVDLKSFLVDDLLLKADKMSMAVSLELRVPFLDHQVVEAMLSLPPTLHMAGGELKLLLKRICARHVPREAVYRRKQGFSVPLNHWFKGGLEGAAAKMLSEKQVRKRGLFNPEAVATLLRRAGEGRTDVASQIYCLLYLEAWHRVFFD